MGRRRPSYVASEGMGLRGLDWQQQEWTRQCRNCDVTSELEQQQQRRRRQRQKGKRKKRAQGGRGHRRREAEKVRGLQEEVRGVRLPLDLLLLLLHSWKHREDAVAALRRCLLPGAPRRRCSRRPRGELNRSVDGRGGRGTEDGTTCRAQGRASLQLRQLRLQRLAARQWRQRTGRRSSPPRRCSGGTVSAAFSSSRGCSCRRRRNQSRRGSCWRPSWPCARPRCRAGRDSRALLAAAMKRWRRGILLGCAAGY